MNFLPIDHITHDVEESHNSQVKVPNLRIKVDHTPGKDWMGVRSSDNQESHELNIGLWLVTEHWLLMCHSPCDEGGQEGKGHVWWYQWQASSRVEIVSWVEIVSLVPHRVHTVENLRISGIMRERQCPIITCLEWGGHQDPSVYWAPLQHRLGHQGQVEDGQAHHGEPADSASVISCYKFF